jgi:hypothetical protein
MSTQAAYGKRSGWVTFAATVMLAVAGLRFISAISYFADSRKVNDLTGGLFGDNLWAWGLVDLCVAALALIGGLSLLKGGTFGRVLGFAWGMIVIVQGFLILGVAPWYGAAAIALASLVLYGLAVTGEEE